MNANEGPTVGIWMRNAMGLCPSPYIGARLIESKTYGPWRSQRGKQPISLGIDTGESARV
jgi:hypothetical protein